MGRPKSVLPSLPVGIVARPRRQGGYLFYARVIDPIMRKHRKIPLGSDRKAAIAKFKTIVSVVVPRDKDKARKKNPWIATDIQRKTKANANRRGIAYHMTIEEIEALYARSGGRCELTNIAFTFERPDNQRIAPWAPSLDRIDSHGPYAVENVRLVCAAVNVAMNQFGEDVFEKILRCYALNLARKKQAALSP